MKDPRDDARIQIVDQSVLDDPRRVDDAAKRQAAACGGVHGKARARASPDVGADDCDDDAGRPQSRQSGFCRA
jgi:hypothetical protein